MLREKKQQIFDEFAQYITKERREIIKKNARERTRFVSVVLEDIDQAHNISAVLRSADCFGIQDVHIIEDKHRFVVHEEIAKGAAQWLSLHRYREQANNTEYCFEQLRAEGYRIVATTPHEEDMFIDALPLDQKVALVFGTEQKGLSSYVLEQADAYVKIPLYGFTESLNISVCAGIALYELTHRLRASSTQWRLSDEEVVDLQLEWLSSTTHWGEKIKERLKLMGGTS